MEDTANTKSLGDDMRGLKEFMENTRVQGQIQFPVEVSDVKTRSKNPSYRDKEAGAWCSIRPCSENITYLGVYLGDMTFDVMHTYNVVDKVLTVAPHTNPAIFVPDLKRVVWGCESWWGIIKSPDDLRKITDADIQNVWYVKALKELSEAAHD